LKKPAKASKALAAPNPVVKVVSKAKVAKKPSAAKSKTARAKAKTPSAKATKVTKPKVAAPAKKAATPATAKPVAGRKPPTVREAVTPKKVGEDIAKEIVRD
jgi:DnaK suppressor protein